MPAPARLILLGPAHAEIDGHRIPLGPRLAALLALLALGGPLPRASVTARLYGALPADAARRNLRQLIFKQRAVVERLTVENGPAMQLAEGVWVDALAPLDDAALQADEAELLAGLSIDAPEFGTWLAEQRDRRGTARREALAARAAAHELAGSLAAALLLAERLAAEQPGSEHAHRRVMRLHYLRGDRAAALAAFDRCERLLKDELSTTPGAETMALLNLVNAAAPRDALAGDAPRAPPASLRRPPQLIGREAELTAWQHAHRGRQTVLLTAGAGMGKTRLLDELADAAPALRAQARPGDRDLVYALLGRLLGAADGFAPAASTAGPERTLEALLREPGAGAADAPGGRHAGLLAALQRALAGAAARGVQRLLIDDLHFADRETLALLPAAMSASPPSLHWTLAWRGGEVDAQWVAELADTAEGPGALTLELSPLSASSTAQLVASLAIDGLDAEALAEALSRHAGGNPLFILETLRAMQAAPVSSARGSALPVPRGVAQLIERRLVLLSAAALRVARCAALAGTDFSAGLASHVLRCGPLDLVEPWRELESADIFHGTSFMHDLVADSVERTVPVPIARHLHADIAHWLAEHGGPAQRVAEHFVRAADLPAAAPFLRRAADQARELGAVDRALSLYALACEAFEGNGQAELAFEACRAGFELADLAVRLDLAKQAAATAARLARSAGQAAALALMTCRIAANEGRDAETAHDAEQGLAALVPGSPVPLRVALEFELVGALLRLGRVAEARRAVDRCEPLLGSLDDDDAVQRLNDLGVFLKRLGDREGAVRHLRASIALADRHGWNLRAIRALTNLSVNRTDAGRLTEAAQALQQARRRVAALDADDALPLLNIDASSARIECDLGHYSAALAAFQRAIPAARQHRPYYVSRLWVGQANLWHCLGQAARAERALSEAEQSRPDPHVQLALPLVRARWAHDQGQHESARAWMAKADALRVGNSTLGATSTVCLTRALIETPQIARQAAREALHAASAEQLPGVELAALVRLCNAESACGDAATALALARECLARLDTTDPDTLYRPELWRAAWRALDAAGDAQSINVLSSAVAWIREVANLHVAPEFRASFMAHNAVNRELMSAAARAGLA